jgi:cyclic beta-1,2-glucan synthetase
MAMASSPLSAVAVAAAVFVVRISALPVAAPLLGFWLMAPFVAGWLSRPLPTVRRELPAAGRTKLRRVARKTWRYFDAFMREEHHDLPPDNYQEGPVEALAARTSPTNIGMGRYPRSRPSGLWVHRTTAG